MNDKVSIIIPCYNGEKFIDRCFNSILNQTYDNIEVIIINDGSTDRSEEIIMSYQKTFSDRRYILKYIFQENQGLGGAINTGLKYFTGDFFSPFDIDDVLMPQSIEKKVCFLLDNPDFDIVRTNGYYVQNDNLDKPVKLFVLNKKEKNNQHIFEDLLNSRTNNWAGSYLIRASAFLRQFPNREIYISRYGQNLQLLMPVAYYGKSGFIDEPLVKYVKHNDSHSNSKTLERILENQEGYEDIRRNIIRIMNIDNKKQYLQDIDEIYSRLKLNIAYEYGDKKLLKSQYNSLKKLERVQNDDRYIFYLGYNFFTNILVRLIVKIRRLTENRHIIKSSYSE